MSARAPGKGEVGDILFLCHRIPFPPDRGDKIRSFNILQRLARIAPVHVGCFADDERDFSFASDLAAIAESVMVLPLRGSRIAGGLRGLAKRQPMLVALYDHPEMHRWVRQTLNDRSIGAVVAYSAQMAHFVPPLPPQTRFIMDFVDFDSAKYASYGVRQSGPMGWVHRREGRKLFAFERDVARRADVSLFVSEAEAALFRDATQTGTDRVRAIDNGVALAYYDPGAPFDALTAEERGTGPLIVFTGQMDYRPNIEAVESFARQVLPRILDQEPDVRFAIVGRSPTPAVRALAALPGVRVTGGVADVRGWLAAADVVVAPLRIARGIQNKILEAMAMARPVVASPQAAEGIDALPGAHLMVARDAAEEAAMTLALLADPVRARTVGLAARARMVERYDWERTLADIPTLVTGGMAA